MRKKLVKNSFANLFGAVVPAIVGLLTIPFIVKAMGDTSYGVLTMVTAVVGYFSILDLSLGSGAVKYIAEYNAVGKHNELNQVVTFGAIVYLVIGALGLIGIYLSAEFLAVHLFTLPENLVPLTIQTIQLAAAGFLFSQMQGYLSNIPQSLQRYDISSKLEIIFGSLVPLLTVLVLWLGYGLYEVVLLRVLLSIANVLVLMVVIRRLIPQFKKEYPSKSMMSRLWSFSMFSFLSRIAGTIYAQADKVIIGALVGMASLTYYIIPFTLVNRVLSMSYRLVAVIYPVASAMSSTNEFDKLKEIYFSATKYIFFVNLYFLLVVLIFAREILYYWMGPVYADRGAMVMILITLATVFDSMTNIPSLVTDGLGHPKVTGLFAMGRAVVALIITWVATRYFGILGAAMGHLVAGLLLASLFLFYAHNHTIPYRLTELVRKSYLNVSLFTLVLYVIANWIKPAGIVGWPYVIAFSGVLFLIFCLYGYYFVLDQSHREALKKHMKARLAIKNKPI